MPTADMQWRARKLAMAASKLADQAGPVTRRAARSAKSSAGDAANWARPRVGRVRAWMAVRAVRGSVAVQETVAPKISFMLATAARKLDPPRPKARRMPKILAGTALLAAGAAAALAMRSRSRAMPPPMPPRPPAGRDAQQPSSVLNPSAEAERAKAESEVNGLSHTR